MIQQEWRASQRSPGGTVIRFDSRLAGEQVTCKALVRDVSVGGIELLVWSLGWFLPGDELVITLPGEDADRQLGARIEYLTWQGGGWLLGCEFLAFPAAEDLELLSQGELVGSP